MKPNQIVYVEHENYIEGILPSDDSFYFDKEDYDFVINTSWYINSGKYLRSNKYGLLSRYLMKEKLKGNLQVDHINKNRLDNRRSNLRIVTPQQNMQNRSIAKNNSSGFHGVVWDNKKNKWRARIKHNRKNIHLGYYNNIDEAIQARKQGEQRYFK